MSAGIATNNQLTQGDLVSDTNIESNPNTADGPSAPYDWEYPEGPPQATPNVEVLATAPTAEEVQPPTDDQEVTQVVTTAPDGSQVVLVGEDTSDVAPAGVRDPLLAAEPQVTAAPTSEPEGADSAQSTRVQLWPDVKAVLDSYVQGTFTLPDGKPLTPGRIATQVGVIRGDKAPSTGAVAALLNRWKEFGFVTMSEKPTAFEDYTPEGRDPNVGLTVLKDRHREALKSARAAEKAANAAASTTAQPEAAAESPPTPPEPTSLDVAPAPPSDAPF